MLCPHHLDLDQGRYNIRHLAIAVEGGLAETQLRWMKAAVRMATGLRNARRLYRCQNIHD